MRQRRRPALLGLTPLLLGLTPLLLGLTPLPPPPLPLQSFGRALADTQQPRLHPLMQRRPQLQWQR